MFHELWLIVGVAWTVLDVGRWILQRVRSAQPPVAAVVRRRAVQHPAPVRGEGKYVPQTRDGKFRWVWVAA
jgi:hypothetical protein